MSERRDKMVSLIKGLAANFIETEANTDPLITVTSANISPDFKRATIYVSVYPESGEATAVNFLKRKGADFRHFTAKKMNLKHIPFFAFEIDVHEKHRRDWEEMFGKDNTPTDNEKS